MCYEPFDDPNLKGISRYLNSSTIRGRANVAKLTFACMFTAYVVNKFRPKKCPNCGEGNATQTVDSNLNTNSYQELNRLEKTSEETCDDLLASSSFPTNMEEACNSLTLKNNFSLTPLPTEYPLRDYAILLNKDND